MDTTAVISNTNDSSEVTNGVLSLIAPAVINGKGYNSFADALSAYTSGTIELFASAGNVTVDKNAIVDLNGYNMTNVTVEAGKTLTCKDSETDDFDANNGRGYGKITLAAESVGTVKGVAATSGKLDTRDYVKITEDGGISFHAVNMHLTTATLDLTDPKDVAIYYKTTFEADEIVKNHVETFGIAFSLDAKPTADMPSNTRSELAGDQFENAVNVNGTKVVGIMKATNSELTNGLNAKRAIHGAAYLNLGEDGIVFGPEAAFSFRELMTKCDALFNSNFDNDQQNYICDMYETYINNMQHWGLTNISAASAARQAS